MPTCEYKCKEHGDIFEVEQKMSDLPLAACQICGAEAVRLVGRPTIFCKDSPKSPFTKDFRADIHKYSAVCESAFGATKKDKEEIKKNWNKKSNTWV